MPTLRIAGFDGVVPRTSATMLGERQAQQADNARLYKGELRPWRAAALAYAPPNTTTRSVHKLMDLEGNARWLTWATDVDVVPGPSADVEDIRIYYTGDGAPKKTNWLLAGEGAGPYPGDWQDMGVPAPAAAPTVAVTTGDALAVETRAYVYTYVNTFGDLTEESAPSPASVTTTVGVGQAVVVSGFTAPPAGQRNITARRIYRTVTSSSGGNYAFVAEIPVATISYTDNLKAPELGEALSTLGWSMPPSDMRGIVSLAGGILAGFSGNTVYFSEPYFPHAWPLRYAMNVPHKIVALGAIGSSLVVLTDLNPYIITGIVPGAMSMEKVALPEPCISKSSVVVDEIGVVYASPNGLVAIGPQTRGLVTQNLFRRDEWQQYAPSLLTGAVFEGHYFGFFRSPTKGSGCMVLSRDDVPALSFFDASALGTHVDSRNARLYYIGVDDGRVYEADADASIPLAFEWRSKRFVLPQAVSFSVIKVDADYSDPDGVASFNRQVAEALAANAVYFAPANNPSFDSFDFTLDDVEIDWSVGIGSMLDTLGSINSTPMNMFPVNGSLLRDVPSLASLRIVTIQIYGDGGQLVAQRRLGSFDPARLAPFKAREIEVKIEGTAPVRSVVMATTVGELRA